MPKMRTDFNDTPGKRGTCMIPTHQLNPHHPDPDLPYHDPRTARAAQMAVNANTLAYDRQDPRARQRSWQKCLQQARCAAHHPQADTSPQETTFNFQLAMRAAVLAQDYAAAAELLPQTKDAAKRSQQT